MMRLFTIVLILMTLTACALFRSTDGLRVPLEDIEPTVRFVDKQEVAVPQSDIDDVDAEDVVASYQRLMQSPHPEVRRQAMRRLADLNMRLAEEKELMLADGKTAESLPPAIREASYQRAAELYQQVLYDFPQQSDDASIRYQLARALALQGETEQSLAEMDEIAKRHQESEEIAEVQFRRGEAYFLRRDYITAAAAYQQVLALGDETEFYDKALYKSGWSLFKQFDYEQALEKFFPLLERLRAGQTQSGDVRAVLSDLINDTQRAISLSFLHMEGPKSIREYFAKVGRKPYEYETYAKLAEVYLSQQRYQDAANTYLAFVETNPLHERSAFMQLSVIDTYIKGGFPSLVLPAKEDFLLKFGVKSEYWSNQTRDTQLALRPSVVKNLDEVASYYHSQAQREKKAAAYRIAAEWYSHFLILYSDEQARAPYHFLMAEALYDAKDYLAAIAEFDVIAYQYKQAPKQEVAAYNILVAYQALAEQANTRKAEYQQRVVDYSELYVAYFPSSERSTLLLTRTMEHYIELKQLPQAIKNAERLLALPSAKTPAQSLRAKEVIANGLFDLKHYPVAEQAITDVLQAPGLSAEQRSTFNERLAQSIYQQAQVLKENQQFAAAIGELQRVVARVPSASIRPNAELEAAILMIQLEQWQEAKVALEAFAARFRNHKLAQDIDTRLAYVYEKLELWGQAAGAYDRVAEQKGSESEKSELKWYAAQLYLKANNIAAATEAFKAYYWAFPAPLERSVEAQAKLVELYDTQRDYEKRDFWRQKIIAQYDQLGKQNTPRTTYLAAKMAFEMAEPDFEKFRQIKLTVPLPKSLKQKRAAMDKALKQYTSIARYQVAEFTTASTHRVGQLYLILAKDIINSERPAGMSEDEAEEYGFLIEDQAFPIEEKAIEIFVSNSDRVLNDIYDQWVKLSFTELAKLQPARYNKQEVVESWIGGESQ
ncbi:MAG: tetratricopeptide repeat protein [Gammaproteobacteria bacterium]|nr:tetratricopeptide repeat protein [Gammaproteobacteria bacterium]